MNKSYLLEEFKCLSADGQHTLINLSERFVGEYDKEQKLAALMGVLIPHGLISLDLSDIVSVLHDADIFWRQCACNRTEIKNTMLTTISDIKASCKDNELRSLLFRIRFREEEQPIDMETMSQISDAFEEMEECDIKWGFALEKDLKSECEFDMFVTLKA